MQKQRIWLASLALAAWIFSSGAIGAQLCGSGSLVVRQSSAGDPESITSCVLTGKIFCRIAEARDGGASKDRALHSTDDWLRHLNTTGGHLQNPPLKSLPAITEYVFAHPKTPPWTFYYHSMYECAAAAPYKDMASVDEAMNHFGPEAARCERQHPGTGNGYGNEELKNCLRDAVKHAQ